MKLTIPEVRRMNPMRALNAVRPRFTRRTVTVKAGEPAEAFRLLALNIRILLPKDAPRAVAVMSAHADEGRSHIAGNLAVALAEEGKVILVEPISNEMPLRERLGARLNGANQFVPNHLRNTTVSTEHKDVFLYTPSRSTVGGDLKAAIEEASAEDVFTVVDTPPALTSSEAFLLAREVGYVVYVVKRQAQDVAVHRQIRGQLDRLGVEILGLVLNEG